LHYSNNYFIVSEYKSMEQTWRHFMALTRKNFIGMKR